MKEKYKLTFYKTSAKDGTNVQNAFQHLTKITLKTRGLLSKIGLPENTKIEDIIITEKENQKLEFKPTPKRKKKSKC